MLSSPAMEDCYAVGTLDRCCKVMEGLPFCAMSSTRLEKELGQPEIIAAWGNRLF